MLSFNWKIKSFLALNCQKKKFNIGNFDRSCEWNQSKRNSYNYCYASLSQFYKLRNKKRKYQKFVIWIEYILTACSCDTEQKKISNSISVELDITQCWFSCQVITRSFACIYYNKTYAIQKRYVIVGITRDE